MITITSKPPAMAFSRNPLIFTAKTSALITAPGLNITAVISINSVEVYTAALVPTNDGEVTIDAKTIVDSVLSFGLPGTSIVKNLSTQIGLLQVVFKEVTTAVPEDPEPQSSTEILVIKAGLSYQLWRSDFFTKYTDERKYYFTWHTTGRSVATWQKLYLNYLHIGETITTVQLKVTVTYSDDTTGEKTFPAFTLNTVTENNLYRIATGFEALRLQFLSPEKTAWYYEVSIVDTVSGLPIYPAYKYVLDHTVDYEKIELNYQGSLGTLESIRLTGEHEANEEREVLAAELYTNGVTAAAYLPPAYASTGLALRESYKSNIGFCDLITAQELRRDLFYSNQVWRFVKKRFWPVEILTKTVGRGRLSAQVRDMDVEWAYNFKNVNFSPEDIYLDTPLLAVNDTYEVYKNDILTITPAGIIANDEDENPESLTVVAGTFETEYGSITINEDGSFIYTPEADYVGPDSYTYTLVNQYGETDTAIINITVKEMEAGIIVMWSGNPGAVPSGWALCNGAGGTPDLSGKFIVGYAAADADYDAIAKTGGGKTHTLITAELPAHSHGITFQKQYDGSGSTDALSINVTGLGTITNTTANEGGGQAFDKRPSFYTLAYIIKL